MPNTHKSNNQSVDWKDTLQTGDIILYIAPEANSGDAKKFAHPFLVIDTFEGKDSRFLILAHHRDYEQRQHPHFELPIWHPEAVKIAGLRGPIIFKVNSLTIISVHDDRLNLSNRPSPKIGHLTTNGYRRLQDCLSRIALKQTG